MKYLLLLTTMLFSAEMEVDGNLKVTGTVDANGNAITNVGAPQSMTDAVNAGILQSALSDDGVYEYKLFYTQLRAEDNYVDIKYFEYIQGQDSPYGNDAENAMSSNFHNQLFTLLQSGWKVDQIIDYSYGGGYNSISIQHAKQLVILKRSTSND